MEAIEQHNPKSINISKGLDTNLSGFWKSPDITLDQGKSPDSTEHIESLAIGFRSARILPQGL